MDLKYCEKEYLHKDDYNKIDWLIFFMEKFVGINYNVRNIKINLTIFSYVDVGILVLFLHVY